MMFKNGFKLGDFTVFPLEGRVVTEDRVRRITPRAMDVLVYLVERAPAVVERDILLHDLWGGRAQSDEPLNKVISELRRALDDKAANPTYIQTITKRGYQVLAETAPLEVEKPKHVPLPLPKTPLKKSLVATGVVGLVAAIIFAFVERGADDAMEYDDPTIAVLPFVDMSEDGDQEYFSDGISEELLNLLARSPGLQVISRTSAFSYKNKDISIPVVARELGATHVLEGSVRKSGTQIRITAQLIDARRDTHIWSETFDRTLDDVFLVQDEIAAQVVEQLKIKLNGDVPSVSAADSKAYNLVLQARYLHRQSTPEALAMAIDLFRKAVEIDPEYSAAWAGMALEYMSQADQAILPFEESYKLAREAANRALALDATNATAHRSLGWIARNYDLDFVTAARHYERALSMDPTNVDAISTAAFMALSLGRSDQSVALGEFMIERDPVSATGNTELGLFYLYAGRFDDAVASFRTSLTLSPDYIGAYYQITTALLLKDEPQAALAAIENEPDNIWRLIGLAMTHHALGDTIAAEAALRALIEEYGEVAAFNIAYVLAFRGDVDQAFEWLDKSDELNDPGLTELVIHPLLSRLHNDPRWQPFLERMGMAPAQLDSIAFNATAPLQ
jgi:TolB-like protein/DNA-binding winged helix-turn-helix (wHTH) protein/Tfp pilus assembly protein PilF